MKTHDNRSDLIAHLSLMEQAPTWTLPSRCKRPPLKPAPKPPLFARLLSLLGFK